MNKTKKLIIFGIGDFAQIAFEYFTYDSQYEVIAFTVNREYIQQKTFLGLPVVAFEEVEKFYQPDTYSIYIAVLYQNLNDSRTNIMISAQNKGYELASYVSSKAFMWQNVKLGEHIFIFENNVIQPFVEIGNNVILWSGNHIGHHSKIGNNCFIASHAVISGHCAIGENCFIGVNSTVINNITIGKRCWINYGSLIGKDVKDNSITKAVISEAKVIDESSLFKILEKIGDKKNS